jgi:hypothetical protein
VLELLPDWPDEDWAHTTSVPIPKWLNIA